MIVAERAYDFAELIGKEIGISEWITIDQEMIDTFGLAPWLSAAPNSLPLGFRQRLALACAVMHRPPVLFLDEPTSGVDPISRREFWTHINGLARKGVTVLVTTHFMDEAEYCDRVAMLYRARLIALDTPDALKLGARQLASFRMGYRGNLVCILGHGFHSC